ncbi:MAG: transporter substrate-binding domain-containing protein, partial [Campylobacteraceae bacterium]|nr:transporter substrate-binding domain-containing protein [Campylobacteraceae bacterium]
MNRFYKHFVLLFIFTSVLNSKILHLSNEELNYINTNKIKIAMLSGLYPFSFVSENKLQGFSHDLLLLISQKSGLKIDFEVDSWSNNIEKFKNNQVDIIDGISFKKERLAFTNFTKPYYEIPLVIFQKENFENYLGLSSLKNKKIGLTKDVFYADTVKNVNFFEVIEFKNTDEKMAALAYGKVDAVISGYMSGQKALLKGAYSNIQIVGELKLPGIKKEDLRFGINKDNKILFSIIKKTTNSIDVLQWERLTTKWLGASAKYLNEKKIQYINFTAKESEFVNKNTVKCTVTNDWNPIVLSNNNKLTGIGIDYWKVIAKHANIISDCTHTKTLDEVFAKIKNKTADITLASSISRERLEYANFSKPYLSYPIAIVTKLDKSYISKTQHLNYKRVSVGKEYAAYEILKSKYPKINFVQVENTQEALKLVSKGEVYAAVDILPVLSYQIGKYGFTNLKVSGTTEFDFEMKVMVRDDYKELISVINKSIDLINEEEKNIIGKKWISVKYEQNFDFTLLIYILIVIFLIAFYFLYKHVLLKKYNQKLELRIQEEVQKNREKDMQMLQQSRMAQMGELLSMVAHQWRQPLNSIAATILNVQTHIDLNKFDFKEDKSRAQLAEFTSTEFNNIDFYLSSLSETLEDFRNFYKPNKKAELMNVTKPIETALTIIKSSLQSNNITLIENYHSNFELLLFKNELMQVFLNLLENSQDSFKENQSDNPTITIETKDLDDGISIEFRDNASSIDEDIIE